jgi:transposase
MVQVPDELGLTDLACSITGLSAVGAAAILAETGDPTPFASARSLVKHAGLAPREHSQRQLHRQDQNRPSRAPRVTASSWL